MFVEWPTEEDWASHAATFPLTRFRISLDDLHGLGAVSKDIEGFFAEVEISSWFMQLGKRIANVHNSYVMVMFYYSKGIPDNPYFAVNEDENASTRFFPNFREQDWYTKAQFDYYTDVFYYKIFSAWESIGHILNLAYRLELKRPSFESAFEKLKVLSPVLHRNFTEKVVTNPDFKLAKKLRNDITHNYQPNRIGTGIKRTQTEATKKVAFGIGDYTFAEVFASNIGACMELFVTTLELLRAEASNNALRAETVI